MKVLNNFPYVVLSFDLWISVKNEDVFFNIRPSLSRTKKGLHHLGMSSTNGTYAKNISDSVIDIITKFNLEKTNVGFACDGGANMKKCSDIICS